MKRVHADDAAYDIQFAIMDARRERDEMKEQIPNSGGGSGDRMQRVMAGAEKRKRDEMEASRRHAQME